MKKNDKFEELIKNIDWGEWMKVIIPVMQPMIIFAAWLGLSKIDNRADAVSKIIAFAEPIPTLDLNVPAPVVLASIYHSIDETMDMLEALVDALEDLPGVISTKLKELILTIKEEVTPEIVKETKGFLDALSDCRDNAQKNLGFTYPVVGPFWIASCMQQKGFKITEKYIKDKFF
jgi:hypothetical protein